MKILLLGDASNYHRTLASALRRQGYTVTVASAGSGWMDTDRDIDISRGSSKFSGAWLFARLMAMTHTSLRGFDIVQLVSPVFTTLRPERLRLVFDRLRAVNGPIFTDALETDPYYVEACTSPDSPLRFNEWQICGQPSPMALANPDMAARWIDLRPYYDYVCGHVRGIITSLYEYHVVCALRIPPGRLAYAGIPVDLRSLPPRAPRNKGKKIRILSAFHAARAVEKGADILLDIARRVVARHPDRAELEIVTNTPYRQFISRLAEADIVLDQLYAYTPATTALLAMALGTVPVTGGSEEYYRFIGEKELRPIINANPMRLVEIEQEIEHLVANPDELDAIAAQGRPFVERYNSADIVAQRFIDFWTK